MATGALLITRVWRKWTFAKLVSTKLHMRKSKERPKNETKRKPRFERVEVIGAFSKFLKIEDVIRSRDIDVNGADDKYKHGNTFVGRS